MLTAEQKEKCGRILEHFGVQAQYKKMYEECLELLEVLEVGDLLFVDEEGLIDELADFFIVSEQLNMALKMPPFAPNNRRGSSPYAIAGGLITELKHYKNNCVYADCVQDPNVRDALIWAHQEAWAFVDRCSLSGLVSARINFKLNRTFERIESGYYEEAKI